MAKKYSGDDYDPVELELEKDIDRAYVRQNWDRLQELKKLLKEREEGSRG